MPRVLQVYYEMLNKHSSTLTKELTTKIFECLEVYYPIDFEGDPSKHNINLKSISNLLDQCLSSSLFEDEL